MDMDHMKRIAVHVANAPVEERTQDFLSKLKNKHIVRDILRIPKELNDSSRRRSIFTSNQANALVANSNLNPNAPEFVPGANQSSMPQPAVTPPAEPAQSEFSKFSDGCDGGDEPLYAKFDTGDYSPAAMLDLPISFTRRLGVGAQSPMAAWELKVTSNAIIELYLRYGVRVQISLDSSVRITNPLSGIIAAWSVDLRSTAVIHPNGRVLHSGNFVEVMTHDALRSNNFVRYVKMRESGISFTSNTSALIYMLDSGGIRTTNDVFCDLNYDPTLQVFGCSTRHGSTHLMDAHKAVADMMESQNILFINGVYVQQFVDGMVSIWRPYRYNYGGSELCTIRTSPFTGSISLSSPMIHIAGSLGYHSRHLFVRNRDRRLHFDGVTLSIRYGGQSGGFNSENLAVSF